MGRRLVQGKAVRTPDSPSAPGLPSLPVRLEVLVKKVVLDHFPKGGVIGDAFV